MKLERRYVEKPWGRTRLPPMFDPPAGQRIGEVWFSSAAQLPLLAKYIFTSQPLSIQVHPDDAQAQERGLRSGKSECWYILDAEPGATLGLGLKQVLTKADLRAAAIDGSIEDLLKWRPVAAGDFIFVPSGTIHAIGGGISLLEFQQNSDVTYRLYDFGRRRELHVEDGVQVAAAVPFADELVQNSFATEQRVLVKGPHFTLVHTNEDALEDQLRWVMPLSGTVRSGEDIAGAGDCLLLGPGEALESRSAWMLIGTKTKPS